MEYKNPLQLIDNLVGQANEYLSNQMVISRPAVNVSENQDSYFVQLAAPGLKKEDFEIDVSSSTLTISANKGHETSASTGKKYTRREYSFSQFKRSFSLPSHVNTDKVAAKYEDGILEIILPFIKQEPPADTRKIKID
ncbi:Hsp20/alpha crystallin family protein [Bernardetia sp.]|uniref:Hsp20/alpha crystallin family protein n=1 Tax=Bernardetia sp. TaxID=1937974 RepID=UPI0025BC5559|nr:Hsp20/alpha crystallin family protein [Bernardetia sp.]